MAGGEATDDGIAGPAQRGDREQQIRLIGEPAAWRSGIGGLIGNRHAAAVLGLVHDAAARPGVRHPAGIFLPGCFTDTDFHDGSMAKDASRPCAGPANPRARRKRTQGTSGGGARTHGAAVRRSGGSAPAGSTGIAQAVSACTTASSALTASLGSSSICNPRCPPFRYTLVCISAAWSIATGTRFFCANGLMPPT
ncbi:hypothetical protein GALL_523640 [mine drainage metagenome]|uniref:Uncharacterized protein n=1 Tax=mine drainage metagenome TaxID=410659 RepID=A0A1J5PE34_9ZZZZ